MKREYFYDCFLNGILDENSRYNCLSSNALNLRFGNILIHFYILLFMSYS